MATKHRPEAVEMTFGKWVETERERLGLTKTECATKAGVSVQRWAQIEYEAPTRKDEKPPRPTDKTCERVAVGLSLTLDEVLTAAGYSVETDAEEADVPRKFKAYYTGLPPEGKAAIDATLEAMWKAYKGQQTPGEAEERNRE